MPKMVLPAPSGPRPIGPYSVAVEANGLVFVSGQVAIDPVSGGKEPDAAGPQARRIMENITHILADVGLSPADICKTTIFLTDIADFAEVNTVYAGYFADAFPARSTVQVAALPGGYRVEIEVIASRN